MESIGLPCEHIVVVLLYLDFSELPKCLLLDRWSKYAKDDIRGSYPDGSSYWDCNKTGRQANLLHISREVCQYAYHDEEEYDKLVVYFTTELDRLKTKFNSGGPFNSGMQSQKESTNYDVEDPPQVRSKGCGPSSNPEDGRARRAQTCHNCGSSGHNRRSCTIRRETNVGCDVIDDYNTQLMNEYPETFIPSSSRVGEEADYAV